MEKKISFVFILYWHYSISVFKQLTGNTKTSLFTSKIFLYKPNMWDFWYEAFSALNIINKQEIFTFWPGMGDTELCHGILHSFPRKSISPFCVLLFKICILSLFFSLMYLWVWGRIVWNICTLYVRYARQESKEFWKMQEQSEAATFILL